VWNLAPARPALARDTVCGAIRPGARNIFHPKPLPSTPSVRERTEGRNDRQDANGMIPSDIYHQRASECLQLAEGSSDIAERTRWRELALCWLRLSEYAEQFRPAERPLRMA
jgi:hypothetical protein